MIKIIKQGTVEETVFKCTCSACDSILEYTNDDIHTDRDGSYIECPVCGCCINHTF